MPSFLFQLGHSPKPSRLKPWQLLRNWLKEEFVLQKLNSPIGYLLFLAVAYFVSWQIGHHGWTAASQLIIGIILIPTLIVGIFHTRFGLGALLIFSFVFPLFERLGVDLPLGFFIDLLIWMMLFGLLVKQSQRIDRSLPFQPIGFMILIWVGYCLLEILNPWAPSIEAWAYSVRDIGEYPLVFFAALYGFRKLSHIQWMAGIWIALATIGAIYGLVQEFGGFRAFEWEWLLLDYDHFDTIFSWDRFRVFSFFSNPASFGILMGVSSLMCLILVIESRLKIGIKILLGVCGSLMILGMLYSGTRTAFLILPAAFGFLMLLHLKRKLWISGAMLGGAMALLIWVIPIENPAIDRLRSAFQPRQAVSFQVRMENQEYVQPYILDHPIGGGVGSTGKWGEIFAPHTLLSMFPPDSGYVRVAVEMGYIGLGLYLLLMLAGIGMGVHAYFRIQDRELKTWLLAFLGVAFALILANYPQQALTQLPTAFLFFFSLAAIVRLKRISSAYKSAKDGSHA